MKLTIGLAVSLLLIQQQALAHHSQAFFSEEFTQLEGELVDVAWRNPHVRFTLRVGSGANEELIRIETNSIYYLQRAGITRDRVQVGDQVVIGGYESLQQGGEFLAAEILLSDGQNALLIRDGVTSLFNDQLQDTQAENQGIYRVWSIPQNNTREMYTPLTDAAIAAKADFDPLDNFSTRCEPSGMPRLMWYPHPFEFVDQGSEILIRMEMYDAVRTIHMDRTVPPEDTALSRLGYSIGRLEGNELIVETTHISWNYYDTVGTPQSEAVEVVERYTLSEDQSRLDLHISTTDPATFTEPATVSSHWLALGEDIQPYECEVY